MGLEAAEAGLVPVKTLWDGKNTPRNGSRGGIKFSPGSCWELRSVCFEIYKLAAEWQQQAVVMGGRCPLVTCKDLTDISCHT